MSGTIIEMSQCAFNLRRLILHTDVGLDTVTQILRFRPTLEHAEFTSLLAEGSASGWKGPFPNLKVFILTKSPGRYAQHSFDNLSPLFSQTPSLQAITLKGWVSLRPVQFSFAGLPLTHLDLQEFNFGPGQPPPRLPQTLEHLSIQTVYSLYLPSAPAAPNNTILFSGARAMWYFAQSTRLPNLKYLALSSTHNLNPVFLHALLDMKLNEQEEFVHDESAAKVPLEHLCFSKCLLDRELKSIFGEDGLLTASSRIVTRSLLSLYVSCLTPLPVLSLLPSRISQTNNTSSSDLSGLPVTDDDIEHLLAHPTPPTSLTTFNLTSTHITGAGVKMLVDNFSSLKALTLDHCTRISSRDIMRYAESKGVKVSMKMEEAKGSARKVRYA
jgi:F-box/TPR repeat protein Pof3